jgi:acyl carrier protein
MQDSAFHAVCSALGSHLHVDQERFHADQHLVRDWGLDRLDLNVIALQLEQLEGIELSSTELECVHTVGQLANLLRQRKHSHALEVWMNELDRALRSGVRAGARRRRAAHRSQVREKRA